MEMRTDTGGPIHLDAITIMIEDLVVTMTTAAVESEMHIAGVEEIDMITTEGVKTHSTIEDVIQGESVAAGEMAVRESPAHPCVEVRHHRTRGRSVNENHETLSGG